MQNQFSILIIRYCLPEDISASADLKASVCPEIGNWQLNIRYWLLKEAGKKESAPDYLTANPAALHNYLKKTLV